MPIYWSENDTPPPSSLHYRPQACRDLQPRMLRQKLNDERHRLSYWVSYWVFTVPSARSSVRCPPVVLICYRCHAEQTKSSTKSMSVNINKTLNRRRSFTCPSCLWCLLLFSSYCLCLVPKLPDFLSPCSVDHQIQGASSKMCPFVSTSTSTSTRVFILSNN